MIESLFLVVLGYLIGSVPFGLIAGRLTTGVDVRDHGSGKTGMTNVLRTVGVKAAAVVVLLDMGKSVLAVVIARIFTDTPATDIAVALSTILGHNWPVFVGFKGGRGIATGWGALFILHPISGAVAAVVGAPIIGLTRLMSLASILGAGAGSIALIILAVIDVVPLEYLWFSVLAFPFVLIRHSDNIGRLFRGEERRVGASSAPANEQRKASRGRGFRWPRSA